MADLNEVRLIGRLTRDPELRAIPSGTSITSLSLATSRKYKGQDGVLREDTTFVDITCWGKTAELVAKYCKKGRLIFVGGRLKFETWEDKTTQQKRSKLSVVAENVQFLDRRDDMGGGNSMPDPTVMEEAATADWNTTPAMPPMGNPKPTVNRASTTDQSGGWEPPEVGEPPF